MSAPIHGLLLAGGHSKRMQRDKAMLEYAGQTQLTRAANLLRPLVARLFLSTRGGQEIDPQRAAFERISDRLPDLGPLGGIHAALHEHPHAAWLVLACDLPFLDAATLQQLIASRQPARLCTAYRSSSDGMPEPLCAIWEPGSRSAVDAWIAGGKNCPRSFLKHHDVALLDLASPRALDNINTAAEYLAARSELDARTPAVAPRDLHVQYFAALRDQAGRSAETVASAARTPRELYAELRARHRLALSAEQLRVAVNDDFADWNRPLAAGDSIVFLPPVAGG
jgi:molybdopterin-guanine dinucleotide biosynthesis protein A